MATSGKIGETPVKKRAQPAAEKAAARPAAKSVAKPAAKTTAKPVAKPATKPATSKAKPAAAKSAGAGEAAKPTKTIKTGAAPVTLMSEQRRYYVEVAAYYIAERRGFHGGSEMSDWVQAEAEVDSLIRAGFLKP